MEKIKLSDLILYYQQKVEKKDDFFKLYFEEVNIESKLATLQLMYDVLGDLIMPIDYFKIFLYAGHWYGNKDYFKLTKSMIKDVYEIIKDHDDIPILFIDSLLFYYDKECFREYGVKKHFDSLVSEYKYSEETLKRIIQYIEYGKQQLKNILLSEVDKLSIIKDQYPYDFISGLEDIMKSYKIKFDDLMDVLPPNSFFKKTSESKSEFMSKYNDYRFIFELLKGKIDLDKYKDDGYIVVFEQIGQYSDGIKIEKMYTSFTKKEYFDAIKKDKVKIKSKRKRK